MTKKDLEAAAAALDHRRATDAARQRRHRAKKAAKGAREAKKAARANSVTGTQKLPLVARRKKRYRAKRKVDQQAAKTKAALGRKADRELLRGDGITPQPQT